MSTNAIWIVYISVCVIAGVWIGKHRITDSNAIDSNEVDDDIQDAWMQEDFPSRGLWDTSSEYYPMMHSDTNSTSIDTSLFDD